ncbi:uncharacterized protein LOC134668550 [Cydia fagiglandana]|uniref:uncharacterized protein LOC134668550 n=1 Tax=Cydia fagiglandana TaxID=1458189 RepID=UPI002FEE646A
MFKLFVLFAMAAVCTAAPRPSVVAYSPVYSPVAPVVSHVPVAYSSQSSTVVHSAPVYSAPVLHSVAVEPVLHAVPVQPVVHSVPVYSAYV